MSGMEFSRVAARGSLLSLHECLRGIVDGPEGEAHRQLAHLSSEAALEGRLRSSTDCLTARRKVHERTRTRTNAILGSA